MDKEIDRFKLAEEAWLFIDKRLPQLINMEGQSIPITTEIPLGIVCTLMLEFGERVKKEDLG